MPRVQNVQLGGNQVPTLISDVSLTAGQLRALNTSPVTLIPAPAPGKMIVVLGMAQAFKFGTVAYTSAAGGFNGPTYSGDATALISQAGIFDYAQLFASQFGYGSGNPANALAILPGDDNKAVVVKGIDNLGGAIATSSLGAGGAGYVANDTGTITTGNADATYKVLTVGAGGAVLTYQITAPGTGYTTGNGQATATGGAQPGVGVGFTVNVNSITLPDGTMRLVTYYQIISVP